MSQLSSEIDEGPDGTDPSPDAIYEDETIRVSGIRGGDKALFVAFTGIGHRLGAMQREEFVRVAQAGGEHSVLIVHDKTRSWYNEPSFADKLQPIVAEWGARCEKIVTIGNSMGGFGAIVFAGLLDADVAIAFSPQFSVSPTVLPKENRWNEFTSKIKEFIYESAGSYIVPGCEYYLFQGDGGKDWNHVGSFPILSNVHQFVIRDGPHNIAAILKSRGFLSKIVSACTAGDMPTLTDIMVTYNGATLRSATDDPWATAQRPRRGGERLDPTAHLPELPKPSRELHTLEERRDLRRTHKRASKWQKRWADKQTERLERRELVAPDPGAEATRAGEAGPVVEPVRAVVEPTPAAPPSRPATVEPRAEATQGTTVEQRVVEAEAKRPTLETLFEDDTLHVSGIRGGDKVLFIAFTEIGDRVGPLRREEFIELTQATSENSVLFVGDRGRTWYNAPSFLAKLAPIVAVWRPECARTVTVGNSMGGFGAIVFAGALGADTAIAFSPQYSVSKRVVPKEDRWSEFVSKIGEFRYESAGDHIVEDCTYFLFQGDGGKDWYQIGAFPIRPNLHQFIVRDGPHTLASLLKLRGDLAPIIEASVAGDLAALNEIMFAQGNARLRTEENDPYKAPVRPKREAPRAEPALPLPTDVLPSDFTSEDLRHEDRRIERQQKRRSAKLGERGGPKPGPAAPARRRSTGQGEEAEIPRRRAAPPPSGLLGRIRRFVGGVVRRITGRIGAGKAKGRQSRP
jgi:hypothetical protein